MLCKGMYSVLIKVIFLEKALLNTEKQPHYGDTDCVSFLYLILYKGSSGYYFFLRHAFDIIFL